MSGRLALKSMLKPTQIVPNLPLLNIFRSHILDFATFGFLKGIETFIKVLK